MTLRWSMMKAKKMENSHLTPVKVEPTQNRPSIAYDRTGSGPPIVFVHGLTYDRRMWKPAIERLSDTYTCINLDLPGHGESLEAERYDLEAVARNIHELVERLEVANPIIVGHSISAIILTIYAGTFPIAGLVTSEQTLLVTPFLERIQGIREQLRSPAFPGIWRAIEGEFGIDLIPKQHRILIEEGSNPRQKIVLGYWREAFEVPSTELQARVVECARRIDTPFTAIFGEDVESTYRSWLSATVPECNVVIFPHAGHFPHLVDPDRFAEEVRTVADKAFRR